MNLLEIIFKFGLFVLTYSHYTHYHYSIDYGGYSEKGKLISVAEELIKDAFLKIRQVAGIRDDYSKYQAFEVGIIMGNIREKYRRMLETYREMRDQNNGRSFFIPPSIWELRPLHYIVAMEQVHSLETDIDKSIHVLEMIKSEKLNPDTRYVVTSPATRVKVDRYPYPRALEHVTKTVKDEMHGKEESLKRKNREKQLLKRIGATARHTAMPRFKHQWPVEESWRLGQYGDLKKYY